MNICILGNAGSGKSTTAAIIAHHIDARVVESDELAHDAYSPGTPGWQAVVDHFGCAVLADDGSIDRARLGELVFDAPKELQFLRSVVDPLVMERIRREFIDVTRTDSAAQHRVLVSYLMVERMWFTEAFHHALVIASDRKECVRRLVASRGLDEERARTLLGAQLPSARIVEEARKVFGSRVTVISNDGDLAALERETRAFVYSLLAATGREDQRRWADFLENESTHLLSIFVAEQERASWLFAVSGALLGILAANKPPGAIPLGSTYASALLLLSLAVVFSLFAVYPIDGYKHSYRDLFGVTYRRIRQLPLDAFMCKQARPGAWSFADYLLRVQYHYRSHWLIAFRRKRMMAWATLLTVGGVVFAGVYLLGQV